MNREEMIKWINQASYEELLRHWRFAPSGDSFFIGEVGEYYRVVMSQKREQVGPAEHSRISKLIGWSSQV